jgi:hypothetical protein
LAAIRLVAELSSELEAEAAARALRDMPDSSEEMSEEVEEGGGWFLFVFELRYDMSSFTLKEVVEVV